MRSTLSILVSLWCIGGAIVLAAPPAENEPPSAARGYELLTSKAYLPPRLDQKVFDHIWKSWESPARERAEAATPDERRAMAWRRYGFTPPPEGRTQGTEQVQYTVDARGRWTMTCFACHQGEVAGRVIAGVPNTRFAMQTFYEDIRDTRLLLDEKLTADDIGASFFPMGGSNGTTNAVMFGVVLKHYRDAELNLVLDRDPPKLVHHDMDAPAWWHYKKKRRLYADGFAPKSHRALMPFLLVRQNGPKKFREWEDDFRHIEAWLESLEAPRYPFAIDRPLAARGEELFLNHCADCHGTYGEQETYPELVVPIDEIGTDPVRLKALTVQNRRDYAASWFARDENDGAGDAGKVVADPAGYIAPPLDGIWASGPYLHNGSVPTLWHLLRPDERPKLWRRATAEEQAAGRFDQREGYDRTRVGLAVVAPEHGPSFFTPPAVRRTFFATKLPGKSAAGHTFPDVLKEDEKRAVLEYLKTL